MGAKKRDAVIMRLQTLGTAFGDLALISLIPHPKRIAL